MRADAQFGSAAARRGQAAAEASELRSLGAWAGFGAALRSRSLSPRRPANGPMRARVCSRRSLPRAGTMGARSFARPLAWPRLPLGGRGCTRAARRVYDARTVYDRCAAQPRAATTARASLAPDRIPLISARRYRFVAAGPVPPRPVLIKLRDSAAAAAARQKRSARRQMERRRGVEEPSGRAACERRPRGAFHRARASVSRRRRYMRRDNNGSSSHAKRLLYLCLYLCRRHRRERGRKTRR